MELPEMTVAETTRERLLERIGKELPTKRQDWLLPPLRKLTLEYGVSLMTIKKAVDALCAMGLARAERGRGVTVIYERAAALSSRRKNGDIGLVFLNKFNPRGGVVADYVSEASRGNDGRNVRLTPIDDTAGEPAETYRLEGVAGLLLLSRMPLGHITYLKNRGIPFVWLDNMIADEAVYSVTMNKPGHFRRLAKYVRKNAFADVWFAAHSLTEEDATLGREMFAAMSVPFPRLFSGGTLLNDEEGAQWVRATLSRAFAEIPKRPELIIVAGEAGTAGLLRAAAEKGVDIPGKTRILPLIGNRDFIYHLPFATDYAYYPRREALAKAREILNGLIDGVKPEKRLTFFESEIQASGL